MRRSTEKLKNSTEIKVSLAYYEYLLYDLVSFVRHDKRMITLQRFRFIV